MTQNEAINRVLDIARSEIGTREGENNYNKYAGELDYVSGLFYSKMQNQPYCAIYVLYCFHKAFGTDAALKVLCSPKPTGIPLCSTGASYFKNSGRWHTSYPQVGDIVFFNVNGGIDHAGIVEVVSGSTITTIEGNTSDMVARRTHNLYDASIVGYGRPNYELVSTTAQPVSDNGGMTITQPVTTSKMKYASAAPLVCMMTQSTCYRGTSPMTVRGVLWHSTGANNPWLKRYVQPDDNASNRTAILSKLGVNQYRNDWNHISVNAGVNAWVGKLEDGAVASVQTLPWNYKPWGCGSGSKGSCNNGWIQFEVCEDSLADASYFNAIYKEACELTAYLCKLYNIDPLGSYNGIPNILCHQDSYKLGMGTNHADVYHWFKRYGKTMDDVRKDVSALLKGTSGNQAPAPTPTPSSPSASPRELGNGDKGDDVKELQEQLIRLGYSMPRYGADGDFGNETDLAVRQLQAKNGLKVDGIVGKKTRAVIEKLLGSQSKPSTTPVKWTPSVGDIVNYKGKVHFLGANSVLYSSCKGGKAKITAIHQPEKSRHPYHLIAVRGEGSTVYGWVDADTFEKA